MDDLYSKRCYVPAINDYRKIKKIFVWKHFLLTFGWCPVWNFNGLCQSNAWWSDGLHHRCLTHVLKFCGLSNKTFYLSVDSGSKCQNRYGRCDITLPISIDMLLLVLATLLKLLVIVMGVAQNVTIATCKWSKGIWTFSNWGTPTDLRSHCLSLLLV